MLLSIISAMDENKVIGLNNQLPWHLPADLLHFKKITWGKPIIMGRKTFESIGKPLPGRENIIISAHKSFNAPHCITFTSLEKAINHFKDVDEVLIIGGASIYEQVLPMTQRMYLTLIHHSFEGNVYFPDWKENEWLLLEKVDHEADEKNKYAYTFLTLERVHAT